MRFVIILLVALTAGVSSAAAQSAVSEASVFPASGPAGTRFGFIASGFQSRERVAVWLNTPAGQAQTVATEALRPATREGRVNWFWTPEEGTPNGTYQFVARGVRSGVERTVTFQVGSAAAPTAAPGERANVFPGEGRPGALFLFFARGYTKGESLALWVNKPDGTAQAITPERVEVAVDRADISWQAPQDAIAGRWELVIVGRTSGTQTVIPFTIR
jgi:hypothetical protein